MFCPRVKVSNLSRVLRPRLASFPLNPDAFMRRTIVGSRRCRSSIGEPLVFAERLDEIVRSLSSGLGRTPACVISARFMLPIVNPRRRFESHYVVPRLIRCKFLEVPSYTMGGLVFVLLRLSPRSDSTEIKPISVRRLTSSVLHSTKLSFYLDHEAKRVAPIVAPRIHLFRCDGTTFNPFWLYLLVQPIW